MGWVCGIGWDWVCGRKGWKEGRVWGEVLNLRVYA